MTAAARRLWKVTVIEDAPGVDSVAVLPAAVRLVVLQVRVPRYQVETVVGVARRVGVSVDEVVSRELEDLACAHSEELAEAVPSLAVGLGIGGVRRSVAQRSGTAVCATAAAREEPMKAWVTVREKASDPRLDG